MGIAQEGQVEFRSAPAGVARKLARAVRGAVLSPGDEGFTTECAGFNLVAAHRPALVVVAEGAADVRAAVRFAARHDLPVTVRSTGHGISAPADGGLLISVRRMDGVAVDPIARLARVEAGTPWHKVIRSAAAHGLAPLNGSSHLVGAVGYTLGGGLGLLARKYGYAADHVTRLEVVGADGDLRVVTRDQNASLFWALRGGKGNFGVVTAMEFELVPVTRLYGGGLFYDGEDSGDVLHTWRAWTRDLPEEMTSSVALLRLPDLPVVPALLRGRLVAHVRIAFQGSAAEGEQLIRPLRTVAPPVLDTVGDMPYTAVQEIHRDPTHPLPYHERSIVLRELDHQAVTRLLALAGPGSGCGELMVELRHLGGALGRPPAVPNAVGNRDGAFTLSTLTPAVPADPAAAEVADSEVLDGLAPWGTGGRYLNFLGGPATTGADQVRACYDTETYRRLADLKAVYDPRNLFRFNHNIVPGEGLSQ
ncbi:FAD-binding oxidoreductase [Kitasatospora sp. NBC_00240]|uniref:FAD-binding protein n=1 Tax=Kitasatospora sp. NBC_00240 TaxID=2903567 RepID=UPI002257404A|nr:FAD-binding oxidoreductase [Kitasatospora sp. NBC_00240]MCX5211050.1 FAD-binding oxidoreductase [Kitasatospora sp. NBC_00240]